MFNNRILPKYINANDVIDAQILLTAVMQGKRDEAAKLYTNNPNLLFLEVDSKDLIGRTVKTSPLRAMASSGSITMLQETMPLLEDKNFTDPITGECKPGKQLADEQLKQQFPNGFGYPPSQVDFSPLVNAITNDNDLIQKGFPNAETKALLAQVTKELMPSTAPKSGHLINLNDLMQTHKLYEQQSDMWSYNQLEFFWREIVEPLVKVSRKLDSDLDRGFDEGRNQNLPNQNQSASVSIGNDFAQRIPKIKNKMQLAAKNQFEISKMSDDLNHITKFIFS